MRTNGVINLPVKLAPADAINMLEKVLRQNGITIYARINQQDEARKAGIKILPVEFIMFGNPAKGGAVMEANPIAALDLPLKVVAWQDEKLNNFIAFNDVKYLAARHGLKSALAGQIDIAPLLAKIFK